jgi:hypothetical protein
VRIEIVGASISPTKQGGQPWDGTGSIPPEVSSAAFRALSTPNPLASLVVALAPLANKKFQPPDVSGSAVLMVGGRAVQSRILPKDQDNYMPSWHNVAIFTGVILDPRVHVQIHLVDKDAGSLFGAETDDEIGTVVLGEAQLRPALAKGTVHQVRVDDQNSQVLLVGVTVFQE